MGSPDAETVREEARARIAGRPSMVLDGDPIEELARAHDRHATRLQAIADELGSVGQRNYLGETSEGRAATNNIRVATREDSRSAAETIKAQAATARQIARALREIKWAIENSEDVNSLSIRAARP